MPRKWYKIILAAGLSAICVLGCSKKTDTKAPTKPVPVTTLAVTPEDVPEWHEVILSSLLNVSSTGTPFFSNPLIF